MTRRAYVYFVLTFVLGAIVGSAGFFSFAWYGGHWHQTLDKERIVRRLKGQLDLSPAQVEQLRPLVEEWVKKHDELKAQTDPKFQALREEFRERFRRVLNPEQIAKFNRLVAWHDEVRKRQNSH